MPKAPGSVYIMSKLTDDPTKRRTAPEAAVYNPEGQYVFHRVGDNIYQGSQRVYYVVQDGVYDNEGMRRFYISGVWWHTLAGESAYYQDHAIETGKLEDPEDAA